MLKSMFSIADCLFFHNSDPGGGGGGADPNPSSNPAPNPQPALQPTPAGKVYSEDYVRSLREESAAHRVRAKTYEAAIRTALGLKDGDNLPDDVAGALAGLKTAGQQAAEQTVNKAKAALLKAEFAVAAAGKVADVDDAFLIASGAGLLNDVEVDIDAGKVKVKQKDGKDRTMADLVADLLKAKPHLGKQQTGGVGGTTPPGGGDGKPDPTALAKQIAEQRTKARTNVKDPWAR